MAEEQRLTYTDRNGVEWDCDNDIGDWLDAWANDREMTAQEAGLAAQAEDEAEFAAQCFQDMEDNLAKGNKSSR